MAFFDTFQDIGGGEWISSTEKQEIIDNGIVLTITKIVVDEANKYGPRYVAMVLMPNLETGDEEERQIWFPIETVQSRDRMLAAMKSYLESDDAEDVLVKLEKVGNSILVRQAE
jgi:DNA-binding cell septation regulator SpoVG